MVGNDVVDLADAEVGSGPVHPRFDQRVFAPSERAMLRASPVRSRLRWMLWAAKEAAYKLAVKRGAKVGFSPSRFVVELDAALRGTVRHESGTASVFLCVDGQAVHAIATDAAADPARIVCAFVRASEPADPSAEARALAARTLAERLGEPETAVRIGSRGRIPTARVEGRGEPLDLSLSHHGRFVAFACDLGGAGA